MRHKVKYTKKEKIMIWLDLCDFSYKLMKSALGGKKLRERLEKMRKEHLENDHRILKGLAKTR